MAREAFKRIFFTIKRRKMRIVSFDVRNYRWEKYDVEFLVLRWRTTISSIFQQFFFDESMLLHTFFSLDAI